MTIYVGLRDAVLAVLDDGKEWELQGLIASVSTTPVVTRPDREQWGGQSFIAPSTFDFGETQARGRCGTHGMR
jgi:hypothetical protein